jgi:hypothetical protein
MGEIYKRPRSVMEWKGPLHLEEYVWWKGGLILLSELRAMFMEKLQGVQALKMNTLPTATSTALGVLAFPAIRPGVYGELPMLDERLLRIKRSLDALYADQPIKLSPAEWKQIVEDLE